MISYGINAANPANMKFLRYLYDVAISSGSTNISFDTFLECRDSIFMCIDDASSYRCHELKIPDRIYSFLGCRRINANEIDNAQLKFHCKPYNIVYCIDFIYLYDASNADDCKNMCKMLLQINAVSKLDAFIMIKLNEEYKILLEDSLISMGYYLSEVADNGIYTFFKAPIFTS